METKRGGETERERERGREGEREGGGGGSIQRYPTRLICHVKEVSVLVKYICICITGRTNTSVMFSEIRNVFICFNVVIEHLLTLFNHIFTSPTVLTVLRLL